MTVYLVKGVLKRWARRALTLWVGGTSTCTVHMQWYQLLGCNQYLNLVEQVPAMVHCPCLHCGDLAVVFQGLCTRQCGASDCSRFTSLPGAASPATQLLEDQQLLTNAQYLPGCELVYLPV